MEKKKQILLWMVLSMIIGYLPWYNFSAVLKYISAEFHLNASDTGMIIAAFQAGYVIVVLITGWLADKIGTKRVVLYATLLTGIFATAFVFVVHDKWTVLIMRLLTGCAAGAIYAPGMALLSNWFAPHERGGALGAYTGALTAASAGGYFVAAPIAAAHGWRVGMLWTSVPVFLAFLIILLFVQEKPTQGVQFDGAPGIPTVAPSRILPAPEGGYAGPCMITLSYMGHMWELYAFWGWIGPYMVANASIAGMAADAAVKWGGLMAACITLVGAPAVWLLGILADKIGRTKAILLGATCSLIPEFFFGYLIGKPLGLVVLVGLWIGFWVISDSAIYKAGLTDMVSPKIRATILGLQSAVGYSMTIIAPIAFGKILQAYNATTDPTAARIWGPAFLALGVGAIVAPVSALILRKLPQARLMTGGKM
ncbi:Hexuronate transporter [Moorella humiferrea]|uniref:MFS transporter n=1 Tax=Neomoorella humiferrea TaxID=676965 RepID=UPI0030CB75AA